MRVSIWRQFCSNHSAIYTVVGEFPSSQAATAAAEKIRNILEEAMEWCLTHHDDCVSSDALTPVEQRYAALYGFDWKERVDWLTYGVKEAIRSVDRLVVIDPSHANTWQTGHQFANLLAAMHANVARRVIEGKEPGIEDEVWMSMSIDLSAEISPQDAASFRPRLEQFIGISSGSISKAGQSIEITDPYFMNIAVDLPAYIEYLRAQGCTNIQYSVRQCE
jgi:hypothetical protein